jgi:DNA repair ATPase RecN
MIACLPEDNCLDDLDDMSPANALNVASRAQTTQYARKYAAVHELSEWEVQLDAAKGKVHECEETIQKLREEIEMADDSLLKLENRMESLKHTVQQTQKPYDSVEGFDSSMSFRSTARPPYGHIQQTRLARTYNVIMN